MTVRWENSVWKLEYDPRLTIMLLQKRYRWKRVCVCVKEHACAAPFSMSVSVHVRVCRGSWEVERELSSVVVLRSFFDLSKATLIGEMDGSGFMLSICTGDRIKA